MRLAWLTDIHLNFLGTQQIAYFLDDLAPAELDAVLITGDIGEAPHVGDYLIRIQTALALPVYFVLGNHDYYYGSIAGVRANVQRLQQDYPQLHYLTHLGLIPLSPTVALLGHDAASDAGYGDFMASSVMLNDYVLIHDFLGLSQVERFSKMQAFGQEAAQHLQAVLPSALEHYEQVYVALHSPPFMETAWHEGRTPSAHDPFLPHFTCKAAGDVLLDFAKAYPQRHLTVLCGHTHGNGERRILPNLHVLTGGADYGKPRVQQIFDFV